MGAAPFPDRPLRILQVNSAPGWGGGEVHVLDLSRALVSGGHEVTVACKPGTPMEHQARAAGLPVLTVALWRAIDLRSAARLRRFCVEKRVDVLHGHLSEDWWLGRIATARLPGTRLVVTRHISRRWGSNPQKRWLLRGVHRVIAVSSAVAAVLARDVPASLVAVIPNGVDVDRFASAPRGVLRAELGIGPADPVVGMVARLAAAKGQDLLLRAAPAVLARHPAARFVLVGGDQRSGEMGPRLAALARELGIAGRVHLLGDRPDVAPLVRDFTVAVLPSRQEGLGLALIEAMAAGIPAVATPVGGLPELVVDVESGLLVAPESPAALAAAVTGLLEDPARAERLARAGQERVRRHFSLESMVAGTLAAYGSGKVRV
jgi:glycosyltransferase involved in cell wall biosynthesis